MRQEGASGKYFVPVGLTRKDRMDALAWVSTRKEKKKVQWNSSFWSNPPILLEYDVVIVTHYWGTNCCFISV